MDRQSTRWKLIQERFELELSSIQKQGREPTPWEGACLSRIRLALDFNVPLAAELELLKFEEVVRSSQKADDWGVRRNCIMKSRRPARRWTSRLRSANSH